MRLLSTNTLIIYQTTWRDLSTSGKENKSIGNKTCVINDPLGQTHSPTTIDHYFQATIVFCHILKSGDGRTDGSMCKNNYDYRPGLWVGRMDQ